MKLPFIILLFISGGSYSQLPDSLVEKIRGGSASSSILYDKISMTGSKTLPCLQVKINGKGGYRFLIDLGSNIVIFKQSVVDEAKMNVVLDRQRGDIVRADKLQIGNSVFNNVYGAAYDSLDVDGVIGFNLLRKSSFILDYLNMSFAFTTEGPTPKDSLCVKYETVGRMPYLPSRIGNKNVLVNFDTGAALWLYFPSTMKDSLKFRTAPREFRKMTNNQTGTVMTYIGQIEDEVVFGNYRMVSPFVVFDPDIDDIFVGSSLLCQFRLTFYPKQELVKMERSPKDKLIVIPDNQEKAK